MATVEHSAIQGDALSLGDRFGSELSELLFDVAESIAQARAAGAVAEVTKPDVLAAASAMLEALEKMHVPASSANGVRDLKAKLLSLARQR